MLSYFDRHPSIIVSVVQCENHGVSDCAIEREVGIIHQDEELDLHDDKPILERWRGFNSLYASLQNIFVYSL